MILGLICFGGGLATALLLIVLQRVLAETRVDREMEEWRKREHVI